MNLLALQGIAANQLAESVGFMRRGALLRTHLVQYNLCVRFRSLEGCLAARETRADDLDTAQNLF